MNQAIAIIRLVVTLLPTLIDAVKAVEAAFPVGGQGARKLDAVRAILQSAYETAADVTLKFDTLWPALAATVSAVVGLANASNLFKK